MSNFKKNSFRKYGGTNFSQNANIVRHNMFNSKSSSFNTSGLYNSKETYLSHLDMSGNSLLHVGNIYFQDGTSISSGTYLNYGLSAVLDYGNSADGKSMINVGSVGYVGGTTQTSAYTGWAPLVDTSYTSPTLTFNSNGKIINVIDNSLSPYGLGDILIKSGDGNNKPMFNLGDITQNSNYKFYQSGTGIINQDGTGFNVFKDTSFNGNITQADNKTIVQIGTSGTNTNTLKNTLFNGNITQASGKHFYQSGTGVINQYDTTTTSNILKDTSFNGDIRQASGKNFYQSGGIINQVDNTTTSNILKDTSFNGSINQISGTNTLNSTKFNGITTFDGSINQYITNEQNTLNGTTFNSVCQYSDSFSYDPNSESNSIPNKAYVDSIVATGTKPTGLCNCATTEHLDFNSIPSSIDTVPLQNNFRVLVKSQYATFINESTSDPSNGIYVYKTGPPSYLIRAEDCSGGDNVTNQLTFISDGCLNLLRAFVQDLSAVVGVDDLKYIPFYSLNYSLGQGLELVGGATLQVESSLNFLTNVTINKNTASNGGTLSVNNSFNNPSSSVSFFSNEGRLHIDNYSNTTNFSNTSSSFRFTCNNRGSNQTIPLQFSSSLFTIDASSTVKYQACNNPSNLPGHHFYGNCYFNSNVTLLGLDNNFNNNNYFHNYTYFDSSVNFQESSIIKFKNTSTTTFNSGSNVKFNNNPKFDSSGGNGGSNFPVLTIQQGNNNCIRYFTNLQDGCYNAIVETGDNAIITQQPLSIGYQNGSAIRISSDTVSVLQSKLTLKNRAYQELNTSIYSNAVNGYYGLAKDAYPALNPSSSGVKAVSTWTLRTSPSLSFHSVCWSAELGIFVAVATTGSGNRVMTSLDGITWTSRAPATDEFWYSVCWSAELGIFVAVAGSGSGNRVMTSPNGKDWTSRASATNEAWYSVCWSAELRLFVAVSLSGVGNTVMTSPNGEDWTSRASASNNFWYSVCWSAELGIFVAVGSGSGNGVMTSPNGINWTSRASAANSWQSVCWSAELGIFVAVASSGSGNRVMTSLDGINWTLRDSAADNSWYSVCWSAELGIFVAIAGLGGSGNRVMTSPNGINWTSRTSAADINWYSVCWSAELGIFVAVGSVSGSESGNRVMTSSLKGRPPTSYNVFDSSFNNIDENGYWDLKYIIKNNYIFYTSSTQIPIVNNSYQYGVNSYTGAVMTYQLNGTNAHLYYKQGQQILISNMSANNYIIECNYPTTGKNVIFYLGIKYFGSDSISLASLKCALLICTRNPNNSSEDVNWNLLIF